MWTESERTAIMAMLRRGLPIAVIVHILLMNRLESQGALGWGRLRTYVASAGAAAAWMAVNNKEHNVGNWPATPEYQAIYFVALIAALRLVHYALPYGDPYPGPGR